VEEHVAARVVFEKKSADNGRCIGVARLSAEKTLNALSLEMIDLLAERLGAWADDPSIAVVMLEAAGDKAFSAGADLQRFYRSMREQHASPARDDPRANRYALDFFSREYRLDYLIHTYPKPVLCWGHGIVMGGGLGLMAGASHRVVTERSRVAMPEVSIGLYPDVGGTWLLGRMPGKLGLFLALTAAPLNAADALFAGVADHALRHADKEQVDGVLTRVPWSESRRDNDRQLTHVLRSFEFLPEPGPARRHLDRVNALCGYGALAGIISSITGDPLEDPWLAQAAATLAAGSPSSAGLAYELQRRMRHASLADVFRVELVASMHCAARPDLAEGIRALIVEKDRKPRWSPASHAALTQEWVDGFFASPWERAAHPLADLGNEDGRLQ
jgi:enoyl-CoA hydratase/carnithine racemase